MFTSIQYENVWDRNDWHEEFCYHTFVYIREWIDGLGHDISWQSCLKHSHSIANFQIRNSTMQRRFSALPVTTPNSWEWRPRVKLWQFDRREGQEAVVSLLFLFPLVHLLRQIPMSNQKHTYINNALNHTTPAFQKVCHLWQLGTAFYRKLGKGG